MRRPTSAVGSSPASGWSSSAMAGRASARVLLATRVVPQPSFVTRDGLRNDWTCRWAAARSKPAASPARSSSSRRRQAARDPVAGEGGRSVEAELDSRAIVPELANEAVLAEGQPRRGRVAVEQLDEPSSRRTRATRSDRRPARPAVELGRRVTPSRRPGRRSASAGSWRRHRSIVRSRAAQPAVRRRPSAVSR
jgi:hypothetical protein